MWVFVFKILVEYACECGLPFTISLDGRKGNKDRKIKEGND